MIKLKSNQKFDVTFRNCVYKNKKIFLFDSCNTIPMYLDMQTCKFEIMQHVTVKQFRQNKIDLLVELNGYIYATEITGEYIWKICIDTGEIEYIKIDCNYKEDSNFVLMGTYGEKVYIFDCMGGVTIYNTVVKQITKIKIAETICVGCKQKEKFILLTEDGRYFVEFDAKLDQYTPFENREISTQNIAHIVVEGEKIYILYKDGSILVASHSGKEFVIKNACAYYSDEKGASRLCLTKTEFIILPGCADDIVRVNRADYKTGVEKNYPLDFEYDTEKSNWLKYLGYCETEKEYFFACRSSQYILRVAKENGELNWIKSQIESDKQFLFEYETGYLRERKGYLNYMLKQLE